MFVLCPDCHNHYDDTCQSSDCAMPSPYDDSEIGFPLGPHQQFIQSPVEDHLGNTAAAWVSRHLAEGAHTAQKWTVAPAASLFGVPVPPGG